MDDFIQVGLDRLLLPQSLDDLSAVDRLRRPLVGMGQKNWTSLPKNGWIPLLHKAEDSEEGQIGSHRNSTPYRDYYF